MKFNISFAVAVLAAGIECGALRGAEVAILDSSINTRAFFQAHYRNCSPPVSFFLGADEYQRYFMGWTYVLSHPGSGSPIPYDLIHDADVTDQTLSKYKLLILSNTASLSDDQDKTIQHWVGQGGRLLATFGAGYKSTATDPALTDNLKPAEGHTSGLHDLWHDPLSTVFGSNPLNNGAGTDVQITNYFGPTAALAGKLGGNILLYGAESNILIHRPENFPGALGFVVLKAATLPHPEPAILLEQHAQGLIVYYAFAPEYLVSKEFNLPAFPSCPDGQNWSGRSAEGRILMESTVRYLLAN
ncbi:MAG TPA: hypothetical protein VNX18_00090 [Bryobacteraceae bacterium]|nr:hypothetical protein [Bryobacteraceae bacterium]